MVKASRIDPIIRSIYNIPAKSVADWATDVEPLKVTQVDVLQMPEGDHDVPDYRIIVRVNEYDVVKLYVLIRSLIVEGEQARLHVSQDELYVHID